jgi:undecaprenyl diphosphate synthase
MLILEDVIDRELSELNNEGVQLRHIGDLSRISPKLQRKVLNAVELTKNNDKLILNVAFNYGGRAEIVHAVQEIVRQGHNPEEIDEALIGRYLYTGNLPDPDLVVRTSGELRISNFLIWQAAYAEYYAAPVFWPDFNREELLKVLIQFSQRDRRYGLVK